MKLIGNYALYQSAPFKTFSDIIVLANAARTWDNGTVTTNVADESLANIDTILAWVAGGGQVLEYSAFIEMTPTAYATDVPEGIPNRLDGEGNPITWAEWKDANHEHREIGGKHYFGTNCFGVDLTGAELAIVNGITGATLLTPAQYKEVLPNDDTI